MDHKNQFEDRLRNQTRQYYKDINSTKTFIKFKTLITSPKNPDGHGRKV